MAGQHGCKIGIQFYGQYHVPRILCIIFLISIKLLYIVPLTIQYTVIRIAKFIFDLFLLF
jgi:hypothetical protein